MPSCILSSKRILFEPMKLPASRTIFFSSRFWGNRIFSEFYFLKITRLRQTKDV